MWYTRTLVFIAKKQVCGYTDPMKKRFFMILGVWIMVLPFLGFPNTWRKILFILTGIILIALAVSKSSKQKTKTIQNETINQL